MFTRALQGRPKQQASLPASQQSSQRYAVLPEPGHVQRGSCEAFHLHNTRIGDDVNSSTSIAARQAECGSRYILGQIHCSAVVHGLPCGAADRLPHAAGLLFCQSQHRMPSMTRHMHFALLRVNASKRSQLKKEDLWTLTFGLCRECTSLRCEITFDILRRCDGREVDADDVVRLVPRVPKLLERETTRGRRGNSSLRVRYVCAVLCSDSTRI